MDVKKAISLLSLKRDVARKLQESWKGVEYCLSDGVVASAELFYYQHKEYADALDLAIAVLKLTPEIGVSDFRNITKLVSMPESGVPLSLEQLKQMDGKPVWVVCLKKEKYIDPPIGWRILEKSISGSFGVWNGENCLSQRSYSSDWLAYSYPPAHIDRSEWTAEWIYPENEWNLPRCSKCGCNSKDATYGHKDNFCPKCGRAMTPEAWAELERRLRG